MSSPAPQAIANLEAGEIEAARRAIAPFLGPTPVHRWRGGRIESLVPSSEIHLKLELMQVTGSFKARGALNVMLQLDPERRSRGVTAVSAGNHAIAVAWAAKVLGISAKVVIIKTASPVRIDASRAFGAEIELADDGATAFARAAELESAEGRTFVHPFEGRMTSLGTATLGAEWCEQNPGLDAIIVAIGGGGLMSGVASAFRLLSPKTKVFGVEPVGSAVMQRSFAAGRPMAWDKMTSIADSLGAPFTLTTAYELCRRHVDALVQVTDDELRRAMRLLYDDVKLVTEPAGAAATAALLGPLSALTRQQRVGVLVCGSNIDIAAFHDLIG